MIIILTILKQELEAFKIMAKIGIYSDVHISKTSSILPAYLNDKSVYTTRLQMCLESLKYAHRIFNSNNVDMIVNCGDTFDSHTISSEEQHAYVETLVSCENNSNCVFKTLVGNHDRLNNIFSSIDMLELKNPGEIVTLYDYCAIDNCDLYFMSFFESSEFLDKLQEMLQIFPRQHEKAILFMHGDINGSTLNGNKKIENRISTEILANHFDMVINGHIHCHELIYKQNNTLIYNIGSLTSHSFADNEEYIPSCWILDTDAFEVIEFKNPNAILFKTMEIFDDSYISDIDDKCKTDNPVVLKIKTTNDLKDDIESCLKSISNVIKYKFIFSYKADLIKSERLDVDTDLGDASAKPIESEFIDFLSSRDDLKDDLQIYIDSINGKEIKS